MSVMMNPDQLVMEYLAALRVAVTGLPGADELVAEVGARIADARTARPDDGPAEVQAFLDRLGNPYEIAADAFRPRRPPFVPPPPMPPPMRLAPMRPVPPAPVPPVPPRDGSNAVEVVAVVALTAGAVLAPVIGPFSGIVMASCSPRWRPAEKVWGWLLVASPLFVLLLGLPALLLTGSNALTTLVMMAAVGGAVIGPVVAGGMLAGRLSRAYPRRLLDEEGHAARTYRDRVDRDREDRARAERARYYRERYLRDREHRDRQYRDRPYRDYREYPDREYPDRDYRDREYRERLPCPPRYPHRSDHGRTW